MNGRHLESKWRIVKIFLSKHLRLKRNIPIKFQGHRFSGFGDIDKHIVVESSPATPRFIYRGLSTSRIV
jgi:hypothetical protein